MTIQQPDILFIMTDQQRFDAVSSAGSLAATPNLDRLAERGAVFDNAYSTCPVCVPARYTIRSGCEPTRTGIYDNQVSPGGHDLVRSECGPYLAETLAVAGYRTWGVGKFHTVPWNAPEGFEQQLLSEEIYESREARRGDAYAAWIAEVHPEFDYVEALMGERSEMYYMPQVSPLPVELTVESWASDRAIELIDLEDGRPWFGHLSFIGPHPPFAPPVPFNRLYDPDAMPAPVLGSLEVDHADEHIPWMNYAVYAEDVDPGRARALKARYYAEISYIDGCIGRLLDHLDATERGRETLIVFFSDHGDLLGDHHAWQKESFFEASTRIPFLVSWPGHVVPGTRSSALVCLTDLFGIATTAARVPELRQGVDVLGGLEGLTDHRQVLLGWHGRPGTARFKAMVREGRHKLIWMANGGQTLLFDLSSDPDELSPLQLPEVEQRLVDHLVRALVAEGVDGVVCQSALVAVERTEWPRERIQQFDRSRGVHGYPSRPHLLHREHASGATSPTPG